MLEKKFRPKDVISRALQKKKLLSLKMKKEEDTDDFGTAVAGLEIQYKHQFDEDDTLAALISAAGPEYTSTILSETRRLESDGTLTFDGLVDTLTEHWRLSGSFTGKSPSTSPEITLATFDPKQKAGKCFRCGSESHKKLDCPVWKAMRKVKCDYPGCPLCGHAKAGCWEDPNNAHKRPNNWKSDITESSGVEIIASQIADWVVMQKRIARCGER